MHSTDVIIIAVCIPPMTYCLQRYRQAVDSQRLVQYHITSIRVCVRACETAGRQKRFDFEPSNAVSLATERQKLERGAHWGDSHGTGFRQEQRPTGGLY